MTIGYLSRPFEVDRSKHIFQYNKITGEADLLMKSTGESVMYAHAWVDNGGFVMFHFPGDVTWPSNIASIEHVEVLKANAADDDEEGEEEDDEEDEEEDGSESVAAPVWKKPATARGFKKPAAAILKKPGASRPWQEGKTKMYKSSPRARLYSKTYHSVRDKLAKTNTDNVAKRRARNAALKACADADL